MSDRTNSQRITFAVDGRTFVIDWDRTLFSMQRVKQHIYQMSRDENIGFPIAQAVAVIAAVRLQKAGDTG